MRRAILTILVLLLFKLINGQNESTVSFVAYWKKGDTRDYRITKKQVKVINDVESENRTTIYDIKWTVIDSTNNNYVLSWEYENSILNDFKIPEEFNETLEKYKFLKVIYKTDELGTFQEVVNWKEIRDIMTEFLNKIPEMVSDKSIDFTKALKTIKNIYTSKEGIERLFLNEIRVFHYPMGLEFNAVDTLHYEELLPNMLGGEPIKGNGLLYFNTICKESDYCKFTNRLELDSLDAKRVVVDLMNNVIEKTEYKSKDDQEKAIHEMNALFSKMRMSIEDDNIFEYIYYPGWPKKVHAKRISEVLSKAGSVYRIDELKIEEIKDTSANKPQ